MKRFIFVLALSLFVSMEVYGAGGDITSGVDEARADVAKWTPESITILVLTKTCKVKYQKTDASGNHIAGTKQILFKDIVDNPNTPVDETSTEFTDLIIAINSGSDIKNTITAAVKIKLGL